MPSPCFSPYFSCHILLVVSKIDSLSRIKDSDASRYAAVSVLLAPRAPFYISPPFARHRPAAIFNMPVTNTSKEKENSASATAVAIANNRKRPASQSSSALNWGPPQEAVGNLRCPRTYTDHFHSLSSRTDPLVGQGRHFGRTIRTFCRVHTLITNGLARTMHIELGRMTEEDLSSGFVRICGRLC